MLCHTASKFKPINYRQLDTNWKYDIIYATLVINNHILAHQSMEEELEERTMRAEENGKVMRSRDEAVHVTAVRAEPMSRRPPAVGLRKNGGGMGHSGGIFRWSGFLRPGFVRSQGRGGNSAESAEGRRFGCGVPSVCCGGLFGGTVWIAFFLKILAFAKENMLY